MLPFLDHRADRLDGAIQNRTGIDLASFVVESSPGDPRHVEQIVDQAGQMSDVAADDVDAPTVRSWPKIGDAGAARQRCRSTASGFRSSCASIAKNSSLRRSLALELFVKLGGTYGGRGQIGKGGRDAHLDLGKPVQAAVIKGDRPISLAAHRRGTIRRALIPSRA